MTDSDSINDSDGMNGGIDGPLQRLPDLAVRYQLGESQLSQIRAFVEMLVSDRSAPTTVRGLEHVVNDHIADALVALELPFVRASSELCDLGSGPGVPGLVLAIALPHTHVTVMDASTRKCKFMTAAVEAMALANVTVLHDRAETWSGGIGRCDVVTARAVADLDVLEEYAAPLLAVGGYLVAWRGKRDIDAEEAGRRAAAMLGLRECKPAKVAPYPHADNRHLHTYVKTEPTPPRFPRRDGVARKRPLGRA